MKKIFIEPLPTSLCLLFFPLCFLWGVLELLIFFSMAFLFFFGGLFLVTALGGGEFLRLGIFLPSFMAKKHEFCFFLGFFFLQFFCFIRFFWNCGFCCPQVLFLRMFFFSCFSAIWFLYFLQRISPLWPCIKFFFFFNLFFFFLFQVPTLQPFPFFFF